MTQSTRSAKKKKQKKKHYTNSKTGGLHCKLKYIIIVYVISDTIYLWEHRPPLFAICWGRSWREKLIWRLVKLCHSAQHFCTFRSVRFHWYLKQVSKVEPFPGDWTNWPWAQRGCFLSRPSLLPAPFGSTLDQPVPSRLASCSPLMDGGGTSKVKKKKINRANIGMASCRLDIRAGNVWGCFVGKQITI